MKKYLLFILISILFTNCKKDNSLQSQSVKIIVGTKDAYQAFEPFENQDTVSYKEIPYSNVLGIKVEENNIYSFYKYSSNGATVFKFDIASKNDKETFISGKNSYLWESGRENGVQNKNYYVFGVVSIPFKIKNSGTLHNDTLEINGEADEIRITYSSLQGGLLYEHSVTILKR